jgi:hypothetical protein
MIGGFEPPDSTNNFMRIPKEQMKQAVFISLRFRQSRVEQMEIPLKNRRLPFDEAHDERLGTY